jgi:hypothetical protein
MAENPEYTDNESMSEEISEEELNEATSGAGADGTSCGPGSATWFAGRCVAGGLAF